MNGLTTETSIRHRSNICYCGHDIRVHTLDLNTPINNVCSQCTGSGTPTTQNKHYFMHREQITGFGNFESFQMVRRRAYYTVGNLNFPFIIATASNGGVGGNIMQITAVVSPAGALIKAGMALMVRQANLQNYITYRILSVTGTGAPPTTITVSPTIIVNVGTGINVRIYGAYGSSQGPGLTANNQRAG